MIGTMPWRTMAVAIVPVVTREEAVQRIQQVVVGARPDLHDDQAGRGVRHEDRQQAVCILRNVRQERRTGSRQIGETAGGASPYRELSRLYGKMLRRASRSRPIRPPAGADS